MIKANFEIQELSIAFKINSNWPEAISGYLTDSIRCYLSPAILNSDKKFFADKVTTSGDLSIAKKNGVYLWLMREKDKMFRAVYVGRSCGETTDMMIRSEDHFDRTMKSHDDCIVNKIEDDKLLCVDGCNRATRTFACIANDLEASEYLRKIHILFLPIPFPDSTDKSIIERHKNAIHELEGALIAAVINHFNEITSNDFNYEYIMNSKAKAFNYFKKYGNDGNLSQIYQAIEKCWKSEPA